MDEIKKSYVKKIVRLTELHCMRSTRAIKAVEHLLHMTNEHLFLNIATIINALPDTYFYDLDPAFKEDLMDFICRNYVFFELNKSLNDEGCEDRFDLFITSLSDRIRARYF
jgi:hypothetical protein